MILLNNYITNFINNLVNIMVKFLTFIILYNFSIKYSYNSIDKKQLIIVVKNV